MLYIFNLFHKEYQSIIRFFFAISKKKGMVRKNDQELPNFHLKNRKG